MVSRSTTTPTIRRAAAPPVTRADTPRAAVGGMVGEAPRMPLRPEGAHPAAQRGRTADTARSRRAKQAGAGSPASVLARVEVVFYKEILDDHGFPHRCELMRVPIESIVLDEAIADAILAFERAQRVSNWSFVADGYEVAG
jgi:hypothetical protein